MRDEIYFGWKNFGRVTAADILDSLQYFVNEDEPISWIKANAFFNELRLRLSGTDVYGYFTTMMRDLTKPQVTQLLYEHLGEKFDFFVFANLEASDLNQGQNASNFYY